MKKIALIVVLSLAVVLVACTSPQESQGGTKGSPTPLSGNVPVVSPGVPATKSVAGLGIPVVYPSSQQVGLSVSGEGTASYVPDMVLLSLGIEARAKTVAEAQGQAAQAMARVLAALKQKGVAEKDIRTVQFSIQPIWEWNEYKKQGELTGYQVSNRVVVKIRQVGGAGLVIDAVAEAGGDLTRIDSIGFTIDDPAPLYAQARVMAVKDALAKAQQIAQAAGITLGKPIYITEGASFIPARDSFVMLKEAGPVAAPAPTEVLPGELEIKVSVQMLFNIE